MLSIILLGNINFTFAKTCSTNYDCTIWLEECKITPPLTAWTCESITTDTSCQWCTEAPPIPQTCASGTINKTCNNKGYCCPQTNNQVQTTPKSVMGITCDENLLVNGQCKMNIYDTLGIRKSVRSTDQATSVGLFVQDIVLSATFFIWTVVTITLIVSGIMFIFAASSGKDPENAKKGMIDSLIGLLIVVSSYVIIRLVQYIAKGF